MKRIVVFLLSLALSLGTALKAGAEEFSPHKVTEKFWTAIEENDTSTLRKYVTSRSLKEEDFETDLPSISGVELGKTTIDGDRAWVKTSVVICSDDSGSITVPIETVLAMENGEWKVLYEETVLTILETSKLARFLDRFGNLGEQFGQKFNHSLEELQRSLPEVEQELRELEKRLKAQLPEIQDRLEDLTKELEELLNPSQQAPSSEKERAI